MQADKKYKFSVSIACFNNWELTKRCLDSLYGKNRGADFEVIVTNNASTDETYQGLEKERTIRPNLRPAHMGLNVGFGEAHNRALSAALGEYFVILNNDFYIEDKGWLDKLAEPFEANPKLAICGVKGNPSYINEEVEGRWHDQLLEYVEASCLAMPAGLARKYGLFSQEMQFAYFEDTDMSLRYRQMGYEIAVVPFEFEHVRGKTADLISKDKMDTVRAANKRRFIIRWNGYLNTRRFTNRILINTRFLTGLGDLLCVTPALRSLRRAHPTAKIVLETKHPGLFHGNPYVDEVQKSDFTAEPDPLQWDSVLYPGLAAFYQGRCPIPVKQAYDMGLVVDSVRLDFFMDEAKKDEYIAGCGLADEKYVVVSLQTGHERIGWEGKSLSDDSGRLVCKVAAEEGYKVVQAGTNGDDIMPASADFISMMDKTDIEQLGYLLKGAAAAVLVDTFPLHLAQALKVPTLGIFGATLPENIITDYTCMEWAYHPGLDCIGCYHYKAAGGYNRCLRGDIACMTKMPAECLEDKVRHFLGEGIRPFAENHIAVIRRAEDLIQRSEAMSQDIMTTYRVLRDLIDNSIALKVSRKLAGLRLFRIVWPPISRMIKKRLLRR